MSPEISQISPADHKWKHANTFSDDSWRQAVPLRWIYAIMLLGGFFIRLVALCAAIVFKIRQQRT